MATICVCSLFRDCADRISRTFNIRDTWRTQDRIFHICVEGDSIDKTWETLQYEAAVRPTVILGKLDLHLPLYHSVVDPVRFSILCQSANFALEIALKQKPDFIFWLESDLYTDRDTLAKLRDRQLSVLAPMIFVHGTSIFYDTWAFRCGDDQQLRGPGDIPGCFQCVAPYHSCYRPDALFEVDSVGSALLLDADIVRDGARFTPDEAIVGFCKQIKQRGHKIMVDPHISIRHRSKRMIEHGCW